MEATEGGGVGERLTFIVAFTAPELVTELDYYLYLAQELESAEQELENTPAAQLIEFALNPEEHDDKVGMVLERFKHEHSFLFNKILEDLGLKEDLSGEQLKRFQDDIFAAYGMSCIRLEILEVYRGNKYNDTCITEINTLLTVLTPLLTR